MPCINISRCHESLIRSMLYDALMIIPIIICGTTFAADTSENDLHGYLDAASDYLGARKSFDLSWRTEETVLLDGVPIVPRESLMRLHFDAKNRRVLLLSVNYSYEMTQLLSGEPADRRSETSLVFIDGDTTLRRLVGKPPERLQMPFERRFELRTIPSIRYLGTDNFFISVFGHDASRERLLRVLSLADRFSEGSTASARVFTAHVDSKCNATYRWGFSARDLLPVGYTVRQKCGDGGTWDTLTHQTIQWREDDKDGHLPTRVVEESLGSLSLPQKDGKKKRFPVKKTLVVEMLWRPTGSIGDLEVIARQEPLTAKSIEKSIHWTELND